MSAAPVIRDYAGADEAAVLDAWNAALPGDPVDAPTFRRKVLLDPNFDPAWMPVAEVDGRVVGFCLSLLRRQEMEGSGLQTEHGWITAFAVHPGARRRGAGTALLQRVVTRMLAEGRRWLSIAPYVPNYFVPGVDVARYAEGLAFLRARGFEETSRPMAMDASLVHLDVAPHLAREPELAARGIQVRTLRPHEIPQLLALLRGHMPPDWIRHGRQVLIDITRGQADWDQFTVAVDAGGDFVGYCQFEDEHFGPFGVVEPLQGQGIGTVLLARCLQAMQRRGLHNAWVLWTSDFSAEHVYGRFGFRQTRRFAVLRRDLTA